MNNACGVSYWKWNPPGSAWYAQHLWERFAFGRDLDYLRQIAYPVLKEVCQFWQDHLKRRTDGTLVTPDGWSPEHGPEDEGATYDQEVVYNLFTNTIEAADALGDDKEFRNHIG
jgi:alpha-L-fucosidase 2